MPYSLTKKDILAIEQVINRHRRAEATVKLENGKLVVLLVEKKKIS